MPQIESIAMDPFSASIKYVGAKSGHHRVKVIATDNYGFTEEVDIDYTVEAITAVEEIIPVENPKSDKNEITAFALDGQTVDSKIDDTEHTISIDVPYGRALNVAPSVLTVSSLAEVYPSDLGQRDFNTTVIYSVKAENGDIQKWTVNVTVAPKPNEAPMVDAGDDFTVTLPKDSLTLNLTLNGIANDNDGLVTTEWITESGGVATIADPGSLNTEVTGLTAGTYVFRLTATDDDGAADTDTVTVRVNNPPTADAGDSIFLSQPRNSVKVYGLASDIDGTFTVKWTQVEGKAATIVNPDSLDIEITGLLEGQNVFELTATDNDNAIAKDRMFVEVKPPAVP